MRNKHPLFLKTQAELLLAVCDREIIKGIVDVHDLCDHAVCFLGNRPSGGIRPDRFYEFCKRSSCMNSASCDFKITAFPCKFIIDLVSIHDHSLGESIQEFTRMV